MDNTVEFIKEINSFWAAAWIESKWMFVTDLTGLLLGVSAAIIMSITVVDPNMMLVLGMFTASSLALFITSYVRKLPMMVTLMATYMVIDIVGIINLL